MSDISELKTLTDDGKKRRKKNKMAITYFVLISAVSVIIAIVFFVFVFRVDGFVINTTNYYTPEEIVGASGVNLGDNILMVDTEKIENQIFKAFPYIESIEIEKDLPSSLRFSVIEATEYFCVEYLSSYAVASKGGKLLRLSEEYVPGTILVRGGAIEDVDGFLRFTDAEIQTVFTDITTAFLSREESGITAMYIDDIYDIEMIYEDRVTLELGNSLDLGNKIRSGYRIIDEGALGETETGVLDLSFSRDANKVYLTLDSTNQTQNYETDTVPSEGEESSQIPESDRGNDIPDV